MAFYSGDLTDESGESATHIFTIGKEGVAGAICGTSPGTGAKPNLHPLAQGRLQQGRLCILCELAGHRGGLKFTVAKDAPLDNGSVEQRLDDAVARLKSATPRVAPPAWTHGEVTLLDRRRTCNPCKLGEWSLVWTSRPGVVDARIVHQEGGRADGTFLSVRLEPTPEFDPERDYVVIEYHEEYENEPGRLNEVWRMEVLAGRTPDWVSFPIAWKNWVSDRTVRGSALEYIFRLVPDVANLIRQAEALTDSSRKSRAWSDIPRKIEVLLSAQYGRPVELGKFATHSQTGVAAIPHRIASRLHTHTGVKWVPPVPQPEYENPEESGRYLLANLYGLYPQRGPGVEHMPQERPHIGRVSELARGTTVWSRNRSGTRGRV